MGRCSTIGTKVTFPGSQLPILTGIDWERDKGTRSVNKRQFAGTVGGVKVNGLLAFIEWICSCTDFC